MRARFGLLMCLAMLLLAAIAWGAMTEQETVEKAQRLVTADLATMLNDLRLEKPELAAVKAALDAGDIDGAGKAYIAYFRARDMASPFMQDWAVVKRAENYNTADVDGIMAGHMRDGYNVYEVPETGIDWHDCPLTCLTRFGVFGAFRYALHHTQDPKYAQYMVNHIIEYIDAWPIEEFVGKSAKNGWNGDTQVACPWYWAMLPERQRAVTETLALARQYPEVADEDLLRILHRMYQEVAFQCTQFPDYKDSRHNGFGAMIWSTGQACVGLSDFKASDDWLEYTAAMQAHYVATAFYPDGASIELTTAYSRGILSKTQLVSYALRDRENIRAAENTLRAMTDWAIGMGKPTGRLPSFGDLYASGYTGTVYAPIIDWLGPDYARTMILDEEGPQPPYTVWPAPGDEQWCGYYTMRSDWTPEAAYMAIDGGPWGTTHQHGDKLSFVVSANGADFIIDPSSTKYRSNEEGAFVSRQNCGYLHNTVTVDGVDEHFGPRWLEATEPLDNVWEHGEDYSLFVSDYDFAPAKEAIWERRVVFVDKSYWLVQDVIKANQASAEIEQNFQFELGTQIEFDGNMTIATAENGAKLLLIPVGGDETAPVLSEGDREPRTTYWPNGEALQIRPWAPGQPPTHGRGWTGRGGKALLPAPAVTYTGTVEMPGMQSIVIVPLRPDQDIADIPEIVNGGTAEGDAWTLAKPSGGELKIVTSVDEIRIVK